MSTPFTLSLAQTEDWLTEWAQPLATSLATGAGFSQGFPVTSPESCNDIGQVYQGPVVLITDAFCYSTTDIFAAGFQDHGIGIILGCHDNTGAGGANVWDYDLLAGAERDAESVQGIAAAAPACGWPRAARPASEARAGVPLEDLGVTPDERYFMTRDDLLKGNVDLIAYAAKLLAARPRQTLQVDACRRRSRHQVRVTATNVDRVDLHVDERPVASVDVTSSPTVIALTKPIAAGRVVAKGYRGGTLVVSAGITIP